MENTLLKEWGLKLVRIQTNDFIAAPRPTTEEDNFGQIIERMDLYALPHTLLNGELSDFSKGKVDALAHMVKYFDGNFAVFHGHIRYDFDNATVIFE